MSYYIGKRDREKNKITRYIIRLAKKIGAINILGGKCKYCGEKRIWVLQFHHIKDKEYGLYMLFGTSWGRVKKEALKCELVCENCHREISGKKTLKKTTEQKLTLLSIKGTFACIKCGYGNCIKALDFHHTGRKKIDIANKVSRQDGFKITKELIDELKTCDVLCSNCHREEHFDMGMFYKHRSHIYKKIKELEDNYSNKVDREKLMELHNLGYTQKKISEMLKCGLSTVCEILKSNGIHDKREPVKIERLIELLRAGLSYKEISFFVGIQEDYVGFLIRNRLKRHSRKDH